MALGDFVFGAKQVLVFYKRKYSAMTYGKAQLLESSQCGYWSPLAKDLYREKPCYVVILKPV